MTRPAATGAQDPASVKQCCARLYESDVARILLGDSFHPGGTRLTGRLGTLLNVTRDSFVLDVASGPGASAMALAEQHGCRALGVDYGRENVAKATAAAAARGLSDRVRFEYADAEALPLADGSVDFVICECAFCTFPDKPAAARELARVLRSGGRVGLCDVTRSAEMPPDELDDLFSWIACLGDARPVEGYVAALEGAGLHVSDVERHDEALQDVVKEVRGKLLAAEVLTGLGKLDLPGFDFRAANEMARTATRAIQTGLLGYAIIIAAKA
jgi:SAM-dependent methyltransferase